jgi:hypothetical protein
MLYCFDLLPVRRRRIRVINSRSIAYILVHQNTKNAEVNNTKNQADHNENKKMYIDLRDEGCAAP